MQKQKLCKFIVSAFMSESYKMSALFRPQRQNRMKCQRRQIKIHLNRTIITVVNSCLTDPFSGPGRTLVSSKNDHRRHGFGLKSVQRVIDRYDGAIKMYFDLPTLTFHTILTLRPEKGSVRQEFTTVIMEKGEFVLV